METLETVFPNAQPLKIARGAERRLAPVRGMLPPEALPRVLPFRGGFLPVVFLPPDAVHVAAPLAMQGVCVTNVESVRHLFG